MPLFSVIIPLYNKEKYIKYTLTSVLNQTFSDFEIIVINDGSTDNSLKKAKEIKDHRIVFFENDKNLGLSATRNKGISIANGTLIALLDADDIWLPDYLENIKKLHEIFPEASICGTDYFEIYDSKTILEPKKNISKDLKNTSFIIDDFFKANMYQGIVAPSSLVFRKSIDIEIDVFNPNVTFAEDIDFYLRYLSKYKIAYLYKACVKVNFNVPNQITRNGISEKILPDLDYYENWTEGNCSLKKYLDLYRYIFAYRYKLERNKSSMIAVLKKINFENLTKKQRLILKSPRFIVVQLNKIKLLLLKNNIRVTSF